MSLRIQKSSWLAPAAVVGLAIGLPGCSTTQARPQWQRKLTFWNKEDVDPRGALAPYKRVEQMRETAKKIPSMSPDEQQRHAAELAEAYRVEADPLVRIQILRTIAHCGSPAAGETLQAALHDSERDVRIVACDVWAVHRGPAAMSLLSDVLRRDPSMDVRLAAARSIGKLGGPEAVPALAPALEDPSPAMQYRAVQSLREATGKDFGDDAKAWREFAQGGSPQAISTVERMRLDWF